ncbi:MAG: bacteriophage abortive infection AbiH family protein [Bacteroidaceae bacterium]|nr:bacteriophage abortive infection AbiH family protein [Bacteroidaceae bacterium]
MNIETVIVLGNGFDLDLGWDTSYKSFYDKHDGWKLHMTSEDDLFQYVIKHTPGNWFDFERTLHEYALHRAEEPFPIDDAYKIARDIQDYKSFKAQLMAFISDAIKSPINKDSYAYRLLEAYVKVKMNRNSDKFFPIRLFSYNYTPLLDVIHQIDNNAKVSYTPVHGRTVDQSIIFGFHDDPNILKEYRSIQKSMDENYKSSDIVTASLQANTIIFFGLSLGYIDGVYFKNLFTQISNLTNPQMINKRIVFITLNNESGNDIKNNLLDMGINLQLLYNSNRINFIFTDNSQKAKTEKVFEELLNSLSH